MKIGQKSGGSWGFQRPDSPIVCGTFWFTGLADVASPYAFFFAEGFRLTMSAGLPQLFASSHGWFLQWFAAPSSAGGFTGTSGSDKKSLRFKVVGMVSQEVGISTNPWLQSQAVGGISFFGVCWCP